MQLGLHSMMIVPEGASAAALPLQWSTSPVGAR
jgi:hypothetical protein